VEGIVLSAERFIPLRQMGWGLLVRLETKTEVVAVHVGPGWFIQDKDFEILRGDRLEVRGSRIIFNEQPAIIATQVKKAGKVLMLRNDNGVPVWSEEGDESG
ncbi:MAG: DNA-binding protein, partial [Thermodesulfobacteriota bacterium]